MVGYLKTAAFRGLQLQQCMYEYSDGKNSTDGSLCGLLGIDLQKS